MINENLIQVRMNMLRITNEKVYVWIWIEKIKNISK